VLTVADRWLCTLESKYLGCGGYRYDAPQKLIRVHLRASVVPRKSRWIFKHQTSDCRRISSCTRNIFTLCSPSNKHRTPLPRPTNLRPFPSPSLPLASTEAAAVLETVLTRLAALFLTGAAGDITAAGQVAAQMLAASHPQTEDELRLAANIVGFSFHALETLSQAAAPDIPLTKILRLRGGAISLSRESFKAQRRRDQLQKAPARASPPNPPKPSPNPSNPNQKSNGPST
jgi:hypothetical protein